MLIYPTPLPLFTLIIISTFFGTCFGFIFKDVLEYQIHQWQINPTETKELDYQTPDLIAAYLGATSCLIVFMGSGIASFAIPPLFALIAGVVIVSPTMLLIWIQLGSMIRLYVEGGLEAINIEYEPDVEN